MKPFFTIAFSILALLTASPLHAAAVLITQPVNMTVPGEFVTGTFQPDGRAVDPAVVTDQSPRSLLLSGFLGMDAGGDWTLFIADLGPGDESLVVDWSLTLTTVPEPSGVILTIIGGAALLVVRRRRAF